MALSQNLTRYRSADLFIKAETTAGTVIMPASANEAFLVTEPPAMYQQGNYADQ